MKRLFPMEELTSIVAIDDNPQEVTIDASQVVIGEHQLVIDEISRKETINTVEIESRLEYNYDDTIADVLITKTDEIVVEESVVVVIDDDLNMCGVVTEMEIVNNEVGNNYYHDTAIPLNANDVNTTTIVGMRDKKDDDNNAVGEIKYNDGIAFDDEARVSAIEFGRDSMSSNEATSTTTTNSIEEISRHHIYSILGHSRGHLDVLVRRKAATASTITTTSVVHVDSSHDCSSSSRNARSVMNRYAAAIMNNNIITEDENDGDIGEIYDYYQVSNEILLL